MCRSNTQCDALLATQGATYCHQRLRPGFRILKLQLSPLKRGAHKYQHHVGICPTCLSALHTQCAQCAGWQPAWHNLGSALSRLCSRGYYLVGHATRAWTALHTFWRCHVYAQHSHCVGDGLQTDQHRTSVRASFWRTETPCMPTCHACQHAIQPLVVTLSHCGAMQAGHGAAQSAPACGTCSSHCKPRPPRSSHAFLQHAKT